MVNLLLVFFLLYGPKLTVVGFDFITFACVASLIIHRKYLARSIFTFAMMVGAVTTVYVVTVLLLNGVLDEWWLGRMPRYLLNIGACFVLVHAMNEEKKGGTLLSYVFYSSVMHSAIVAAQLLSPGVNGFIIGALDNYQESEIRFSGLVRGLTPPSFVMAASIGVGYYCYVKGSVRLFGLIFGSLLIFLACLVMGRAGLYMGLTASVLAILFDQVYKGRILLLVVFGVVLIFVFGLFVYGVDDLPLDPIIISGLKYGLEPLFNYIDTGVLSSSSIDDFEQHRFIFHNKTFLQIMFGTGLYGRGDPATYLQTDIAYAHMFSAFGVVGLVLICVSTLSMVIVKIRVVAECRYLFFLTFVSVVFSFILNYKETVLLTRHVASLLAFLWATLHFEGLRLTSPKNMSLMKDE